ncbi:hypothetical protein K0B96_00370 [Horticoccus luteus]|uniref:Uncharacterized protein n=1 Tax=Horticoccus luteus TaxID=2862869 RepID=A0A8F9XJW7_9BACT|nr:hypothetical protein [Horticoccus luteus]QYM79103.1 hypothetical protein K0B96_00370 [Horticoccus luteus]
MGSKLFLWVRSGRGVAALALGATLAAASVSQATIHVFRPRADYEVSTTNIPIAYFATESQQISTAFLGPFTRGIRIEAQSGTVWVSPQQSVAIASTAKIPHYDPLTKRFAAGELVDGASFQNAGSDYLAYTSTSEFTIGESAYLGFSFIAAGPGRNFGWMAVERVANGVIVKAWAYQDQQETPIAAGAETDVAPAAEGGHLTNLSVRTGAGVDAQTLIVGYVVGGAGTTGGKSLLVRGVGPALGNFGVTGFVADPAITVYAGNTVEATNQDWAGDAQVTAAAARLGAFALDAQSKDAALLATSAAGAHTLHVTSGVYGVALAEIYDAATSYTATDARLINVSARAQAGSGNEALIAGFVIGGTTSRTLLIRAVGPGLAGFGVANTLVDPKLTLFAGNTTVAENDNWSEAANAATVAQTAVTVGAFALTDGSKDAAIQITLEPGVYTAHVTAASGGAGAALVEIYEVAVP